MAAKLEMRKMPPDFGFGARHGSRKSSVHARSNFLFNETKITTIFGYLLTLTVFL
jgi:hypothetical protein